jgi:hypothetical protein
VQDAGGECLAHCDAIHGEHIDAATAIQLAKAMIRDGRMPTPEDAAQRLQDETGPRPHYPTTQRKDDD